MRLYDLANVARSKNAGPFTLAIDLIFKSEKDFDRALSAEGFSAAGIAALYRVKPEDVRMLPFKRVLAIKVAMPRPIGSGAPGDCDVYGSQQHFPLASLEIA